MSPALRRGLKPELHEKSLSQKAGEAQQRDSLVIKNTDCSARRPVV